MAATMLWTTMLMSGVVVQSLQPSTQLRALFEPKADSVLCDPISKEPLQCSTRSFDGRVTRRWRAGDDVYTERAQTYVDLVSPAALPTLAVLADNLRELVTKPLTERVQVDTFRSPLTAFLYERGWRDSFKRSGFPGIDAEFAEVKAFFGPALTTPGEVVVDLSCGTGLMARRLAQAKGESVRLIAADYSEAMLMETSRRFESEERPELIRVDVGALPFAEGALSAVHAGAALHCWPDCEAGLAEVRRALKPEGGKFFATTFLRGALGSDTTGYRGFRFFELEELERMMLEAGFDDVEVRREGTFCAVVRCSVNETSVDGAVNQTASPDITIKDTEEPVAQTTTTASPDTATTEEPVAETKTSPADTMDEEPDDAQTATTSPADIKEEVVAAIFDSLPDLDDAPAPAAAALRDDDSGDRKTKTNKSKNKGKEKKQQKQPKEADKPESSD